MNKQIIQCLSNGPLTMNQLSEQLQATSAKDYKELVKSIAFLEEQGNIQFLKNGKIALPFKQELVEGLFRANDKGFGFVSVEGMDSDIYITRDKSQTAMSGDTVKVRIDKAANLRLEKAAEGSVVEIIERAYTQIVGEFVPYPPQLVQQTEYIGYVIPKDKKISQLTCFITKDGLDAVSGTIVLVSISEYPSLDNPNSLSGVIIKEIGHKDAPGVDILSVLYKFDVPTEFSNKALEQASEYGDSIPQNEIEGRRDLRHLDVITIDGADAKDLDDAISLQILENGHFELGVHIADVSHYVTKDSPLDSDAYLRATSVYLTDRVVPMLPQRLSNGICSLHPHVDRLTMSCVMEIDASGEVVKHEIFESVIQSKQRMVYDRVNMAIVEHNKNAREEYAPFLTMLEDMRTLHFSLYHKRFKRGAIDFDAKESKIIVDENGAPLDIVLRERGLAERMIESFMLVANETIAKHYMDKKLPMIYRVHEQPAEEKMQRFMEFVTHFGVLMKGKSETITSKQLQQVLSKVENEPFEAVVSTVLLRSMKQAKYDNHALGHFGLATDTYTHFTSPIRRYPDLIVHRMIKLYATKTPTSSQKKELESELEDIAHQSSIMERKAVEAERDVDAMKKAEFMLDKINQKFEGVISSVTRFGLFVELPNTIEGLIHVSKMTDDHYEFIENQLVLVGKRTGKTYSIGQKVNVIVTKVDVEQRDIDFELVLSGKKEKRNKKELQSSTKKQKQVTKRNKKMKEFVRKKKKRRN